MLTCPSHETLARLGHNSLDGAAWAALEAHVQHCAQCVAVLEKLVAHHTVTAPASALLPPEDNLPRITGFDIERELGRGGMGVVYRAWEQKLARNVALKILPSGPTTGERERSRWLSEARFLTRVCHPNVVQIHDAAEADGWLYLVLEFVSGGSLKERLRQPLPPRAAALLMRPVARAISVVHRAGLLHLDLKPSNILLDSAPEAPWKDASPKVADFGIARPTADLDAPATSLAGPWGTPSYMAPEQIKADRANLGPATDVYALGAILYELLTGRPPFHGASTLDTLDQVRGQNPVPPRRLNPKIPRDLETIALKCLEKNPLGRYSSAEAMADELDRFLEGRPINARPISSIEHAWRWCRRQPVIAGLAATLFLTVIGSFLGLLALLRRSDTLRSQSDANYRVASRSLDEIVRILSHSEIYGPSIKSRHELEKTLENARSQEIELSKRHPVDVGDLKRLATIDEYLAQVYLGDGKPDQARSLMEESIGYFEAYLAGSPFDVEICNRLFGATNWMAMTYHGDSKNHQLFAQWHARAVATLEGLKSFPDVHARGIYEVSRWQHRCANAFMLAGESARARQELEEVLAFVRSVPVAESGYPEIVLCEALTLDALGRWSGEFPRLRSPTQTRPANVAIRDLERQLAELTASRIGWLPSIGQSPCIIPQDLAAEAWTDRVISLIQSDAASFGLDHNHLPAICWRMKDSYWHTLWRQRQAGKLADAQLIVDRLFALAGRLTGSYPNQAVPYLLLSEAYVQRAKIAYRVEDEPVDGWERKALEAAIQAAAREPENAEARDLVKNRLGRLDKLASSRRSPSVRD